MQTTAGNTVHYLIADVDKLPRYAKDAAIFLAHGSRNA
jgi:hypothetical protein